MPAARIRPPTYPFKHVLEHPLCDRIDPKIPIRVSTYDEPQRQTCNVVLGGRRRSLVFIVKRHHRGPAAQTRMERPNSGMEERARDREDAEIH